MEDFPNLLGKWEENKGNCNMVIVESCKGQRPKKGANLWSVTRGGIRTRMDLERGESSSLNVEGNI
jgi:hypothetical protein